MSRQALVNALLEIKNTCKEAGDCRDCPLRIENWIGESRCTLEVFSKLPEKWDINMGCHGDANWRAFND